MRKVLVNLAICAILASICTIGFIKVDPLTHQFRRVDIDLPSTVIKGTTLPTAFQPRTLPTISNPTRIVLGENVAQQRLYQYIASDLQQAIYERAGVVIPIVDDTKPIKNRSILIGGPGINSHTAHFIDLNEFSPPRSSQSFSVVSYENDSGYIGVAIIGNDSLGDAYGVY
ncbi:MAG: hypothetical protein DDT40_00296 [candidate division WS2 bacterium]|nr:hypothetical protein [Bacillota bacterium]MBT9150130.1 hypothetical protein [Candidatus Psychracetigena formicireducens]